MFVHIFAGIAQDGLPAPSGRDIGTHRFSFSIFDL